MGTSKMGILFKLKNMMRASPKISAWRSLQFTPLYSHISLHTAWIWMMCINLGKFYPGNNFFLHKRCLRCLWQISSIIRNVVEIKKRKQQQQQDVQICILGQGIFPLKITQEDLSTLVLFTLIVQKFPLQVILEKISTNAVCGVCD